VSSPIWDSCPDIYYCLTVTILFFGAPSLTRGRVCLFYVLVALAGAVFLGSKSLGTRYHILLSQIRHFHFRRLLRLAGSRWRYSTPPPHGFPMSVILGISLFSRGTDHTENTVLLSELLRNLANWSQRTPFLLLLRADDGLFYCLIMYRVYRDAAWQRVDQIRYNTVYI
jgi:hypothetical protein